MPASESIPPSPDAPPLSPYYKWWVVGMLWFICFFNYADRQAIGAVLPKLREEFHFDKETQGYILSAFMWIYAAGAPLAGYIGDRLRRKDLILGGCLFWSLITTLTGFCTKFWHFVTVRAFEGLGETFYFPASMSLVSDYHSGRTRSRAMSVHQASVYAGTVGGSWLAAILAERYNWRLGFYIFGFCGMALAVLLYFFLREPRRGEAEAAEGEVAKTQVAAASIGETMRLLFTTPTALLLLLAFLGANAVAQVVLFWTPTYLVEKFNFKLGAAGLNGAVYIQVGSMLSVPVAGYLADSLTRRLPGGRMLVQAAGLILGSGFIFLMGTTVNVSTLILAMGVFGVAKGIYDAGIFASMYDVVPPQARASAAGLMNTIGYGGGALGTALFGWLAQHGHYGSDVENMSHTIAFGALIYLGAAVSLLLAGLVFAKRDSLRARGMEQA